MIKKINFFLSFIIFLLVLFSSTSILKGLDINKALYENTLELHIIYTPETDYKKLVKDISSESIKNQINVSQYNFSDKDTLNIISTNPKVNPSFDLKKGTFPKKSETSYVTNYLDEDNVGLLNLPSDYFKIKLYSFEQIKNIGLGNVFYIQGKGNKQEIISVFQKYGTVKLSKPTISDTFAVNAYQNIILLYVIIFFFVCILSMAFSQRKVISLKKILGYSAKQIVLQSMKSTYSILYGLIVSLMLFIAVSKRINLNLLWSILLCLFIYLFSLILYIAMVLHLYYFIKEKNNIKGATPSKLVTIILGLLLCTSLFLFLEKSQKIQSEIQKYSRISQSNNVWLKTKNLYKTNITNQLDRDDNTEEKAYLKNAQKFYEQVSTKYKTFIIAPYNYTVIQNADGTSRMIGQDRIPDKEEFITSPGGADITIDRNYLKINPIKFATPSEKQLINSDAHTLSILVPKKYKKYEAELIKNYLSDVKFRLTEDPPNGAVSLDKLKIQVLYVENKQTYFTYNMFYGNENEKQMIEDPIAIIVNPKLMDGLFWGNILTMNGGLFIDFDNTTKTDPFDRIKKDVRASGLNGIINFTISVFKERGEDVARNEVLLFNLSIQYGILIILLGTLNVQISSLIYKINSKKLFVKKILGYSTVNQSMDVVFFPIMIEIMTTVVFYILNSKNAFGIFPLLLIIFVNLLIYVFIQLKNKSIALKEDFYDS